MGDALPVSPELLYFFYFYFIFLIYNFYVEWLVVSQFQFF